MSAPHLNSLYLPARSNRKLLLSSLVAFMALLVFALRTSASTGLTTQVEQGGVCPPAPVSGNITVNTTWGGTNCVVEINGFFQVLENVTLTIEPGVTVEVIGGDFNQISINGNLHAVGSASQPITFTSDEDRAGSWGGVNLGNTPENPASATLQHVIMEYGRVDGLPNDGIMSVDDATLNISNSQFRNGGSNGLVIEGEVTGSISSTSFTNNGAGASEGGAALRITYLGESDLLLSNLSATGNRYNGVEYRAIHLTRAMTWAPAGIPYIVSGGFFIEPEGSLTIQPGVTVKARKEDSAGFTLGTTIYVDGSLTASGTPASPILFTGVAASTGAAIDWGGIGVSGGDVPANLTLQHVIIERAGSPDEDDAGLRLGDANAQIHDTTIRDGLSNGLSFPSGGDANTITVSNTTITNNDGYPIWMGGGQSDPHLDEIETSGNQIEAIAVDSLSVPGEHIWENIGLPYHILDSSFGVFNNDTLTLEPGVELHFPAEGSFNVSGNLFAVGTPGQMIRFVGPSEQPGSWEGIQINESSTGSNVVVLQYCDIGYGGMPGTPENDYRGSGLLRIATSSALVSNCRIHHSEGAGIEVYVNSSPFIRRNRIENNVFGLQNNNGGGFPMTVDARDNWWGHASGPRHPTLNPAGQGNGVSDLVLFDPWLTDPDHTGTTTGLRVEMASPTRAQIGGIESYGVAYINDTNQTIQDAVLLVNIPSYADYMDDSGEGIYWPQYRQLFWKLGTLDPGEAGLVSFRVRFFSGLPPGLTDFAQAFIAGSNAESDEFDVQPYLDYVPTEVESETDLTQAQVATERAAHPELEEMYQQLLSEGYIYGAASRFTYSVGDPMTLVVLLNIDQRSVAYLKHQSGEALTTEISETYYTVRNMLDGGGGMRVDLETEVYELYGSWSTTGQFETFNPDEGSFGDCMKNCIIKLIPKHVIKNVSKTASTVMKVGSCVATYNEGDLLSAPSCASLYKKIPGVSEGIDLGKCNAECENNPKSHVCTGPIKSCGSYLGGWLGIDAIYEYECDLETGRYSLGPYYMCPILENKCKYTADGTPYCTACTVADAEEEEDLFAAFNAIRYRAAHIPDIALPAAQPAVPLATTMDVLALIREPWAYSVPALTVPQVATAGADEVDIVLAPLATTASSTRECCDVVAAKDPNAKYGPDGDVTPGQLVTYRITYENIGEATAFDVFIMDPLSEHFDDSTLVINNEGRLLPSRSIMWEVGDLAPQGEAGSSGEVTFSVRIKAGLPSGTVILNQAVVHFPSVPEVTPTDPVVSVIQPLAAFSQELETEAGDPLAIMLSGRDVSSAPLTYTLVEQPMGGEISGTPPAITYTPDPTFIGVDRIRFTVSNGTSTSRPGDVEINVVPAADDNTAPQVTATDPVDDEVITDISTAPVISDSVGLIYLPRIRIRFSEPMDLGTLEGAIQLRRGGQSIPFAWAAEGIVTEAIINPRQPLQEGSEYTVTIGTGARDLRGNPLAAAYSFTFQVGGGGGQDEYRLYLPLTRR